MFSLTALESQILEFGACHDQGPGKHLEVHLRPQKSYFLGVRANQKQKSLYWITLICHIPSTCKRKTYFLSGLERASCHNLLSSHVWDVEPCRLPLYFQASASTLWSSTPTLWYVWHQRRGRKHYWKCPNSQSIGMRVKRNFWGKHTLLIPHIKLAIIVMISKLITLQEVDVLAGTLQCPESVPCHLWGPLTCWMMEKLKLNHTRHYFLMLQPCVSLLIYILFADPTILRCNSWPNDTSNISFLELDRYIFFLIKISKQNKRKKDLFPSGERKHHLKSQKLFKYNVQKSTKNLPGIPRNKIKLWNLRKKENQYIGPQGIQILELSDMHIKINYVQEKNT